MAVSKGNAAVILVGTSNPPTTVLGKHMDANEDITVDKTDSTTNDSAGSKTHELTLDDGTLTGKFYTDRLDAGQIILRTAWQTKTKIFVAYREAGTGTGLAQTLYQASVALKRGSPMNGLATTDFTLSKDGVATFTVQ